MKANNKHIFLTTVMLAALLVGGCEYDKLEDPALIVSPTNGTDTAKVSGTNDTIYFSKDIMPIFNVSCNINGCHAGSPPAATIDLSKDLAYSTVTSYVIDTLKPESNKIYNSIVNGSMPIAGKAPKVSASGLAKFKKWIQQGGIEN